MILTRYYHDCCNVHIRGGIPGYLRCFYNWRAGGDDYALKTLKSMYGSKHRIMEGIIKSLRRSKPVKSAQDMCALSHELRNVFHVLQSVDSLAEVNAQVIIFDIVAQLPNFVQNWWQREEFKSKHNSDTYHKFVDLVHFIEQVAKGMNDPLCGSVAPAEHTSQKKHVTSHVVLEQKLKQCSCKRAW